MTGTVMTVRGPVAASELGRVLPHEHVVCELAPLMDPAGDAEAAIADLVDFREAGGQTVIDCTNLGLGRDPAMLVLASERADLHIVMGSGWYREPTYTEDVFRASTAELTERLLHDLREGVYGIKPGIIGEIGADREYLSGIEERVLRAAARAHNETGLPVILHAAKSRVGEWQLDVLAEEGVDLRRVAVSHADMYPDVDYHELLARRGAFVIYDRNSPRSPVVQARRIRNAAEFIRRGFGAQLLLSHDVCIPSDRSQTGGPGYSYVLRHVAPDLVAAGVDADVVESITTENPARLLTDG